MAKSKPHVPTINPPNGGMMAWLQQNDQVANVPQTVEVERKEETTDTQVDESKPIENTDTPVLTSSHSKEETPNKAESQPNKTEVVIKEEEGITGIEATATNTSVSASRKPKSKVGEGTRSSSYLETFFKKPVKANGTSLAGDGKPVRVSEESHLLLSVLVSEARRLGYKLNVGDLIDNLLTHHRLNHKKEVDELIANWKTRKSFD